MPSPNHQLKTSDVYAPGRATLPDVFAFANTLNGRYATDRHYGIIRGSNLIQYDGVA